VKLGAVLHADALIARIDDDQVLLHAPAELLDLRRRLTNECHEHRIPLSGGAFDAGVPPRDGHIPARLHLPIGGERCHLGLEISTRTYEAVSAYLRTCGAVDTTADLLERIEMYEPDSVSELGGGVVLDHIEQGHSWDVRVPCDGIAELRAAVARAAQWAEQHDAALQMGDVEFPPVLAKELYVDLSPKSFDQEAEIVRALSYEPDDPEPLLFRTVRARMCVGIRQDGGRVWLILEPRQDRVVKSNDGAYAIGEHELARIGRAARVQGAVERELREHTL
jgi:hypothetical protein